MSRNKPKILISLTEHFGDIIAAEPVIRALRSQCPGSTICWITNRDYANLVKNHPDLDRVITVTSLTEWILLRKFLNRKTYRDLHISGRVCEKHHFQLLNPNPENISTDNYLNLGNLLFGMSHTAGINLDTEQAPQLKGLQIINPQMHAADKTIVLHTEARNAGKNWTSDNWASLTKLIWQFFPEYTIIETGFKPQLHISDPRLKNACGRKKATELASLIDSASFFIGVESGLAHMANALGKEAVILIGPLGHFSRFMPYSGKYEKERELHLIYLSRQLRETGFTEIEEKIREMLVQKKKKINQ